MYKYSNKEHTRVTNLETRQHDIHPGMYLWVDYQKWIDNGGITEPFDTRTPSEIDTTIREEVWEKIKAERDRRVYGGVLVDGSWFDTDLISRIRYIGLKDELMEIAGEDTDAVVIDGEPVLWKTLSNTFVPVTRKLVKDLMKAIKILDKRAFKTAETHKVIMKAMTDPLSYDFSEDWPPTYEEV